MARMYSEQTINAFKEKLESLISYEQQGIEFEKTINPESVPVVRTISIEVYKNVLKMFTDHMNQKATKRSYNYTSGKRPGRPPRKDKENSSEEVAATSEK